MESYRSFERKIARSLHRFPKLYQALKLFYQRFNYWCFSEKRIRFSLHPQVRILTPSQWVGETDELSGVFFGYYDKSPWSHDMRRATFHRLSGDGRIEILVYDREAGVFWRVGYSSTWNYQQGSMLQWMPNDNDRIIFNDLVDGNLVSRIVSVDGCEEKVIPWPVQAIHPSGRESLTLNYRRLSRIRPDYGYSVTSNNFSETQEVERDGIWWVDLESGRADLVLSLNSLMNYSRCTGMASSQHRVNHLLYSPSGQRFAFVHRWGNKQGRFSRLYVSSSDMSELRLLMEDRVVSHYCWYDHDRLLVWARVKGAGEHYYMLNVATGTRRIVGQNVLDTYGDGHPSFSPDEQWLVTDTYPDRARLQHLLLYNVRTGRIVELGRFLSPINFRGSKRCDLHPRWSPDGKMISIDSAYNGKRGSYFLDVSALV